MTFQVDLLIAVGVKKALVDHVGFVQRMHVRPTCASADYTLPGYVGLSSRLFSVCRPQHDLVRGSLSYRLFTSETAMEILVPIFTVWNLPPAHFSPTVKMMTRSNFSIVMHRPFKHVFTHVHTQHPCPKQYQVKEKLHTYMTC